MLEDFLLFFFLEVEGGIGCDFNSTEKYPFCSPICYLEICFFLSYTIFYSLKKIIYFYVPVIAHFTFCRTRMKFSALLQVPNFSAIGVSSRFEANV